VDTSIQYTGAEKVIHEVEIYLGILIGAVTFSGSLIAFGKLNGKIGGKPLLLPARHWLNLLGLLVVIWFGGEFVRAGSVAEGMTPLIIMTVIALLFGIHMVMAIGGADMPVVVSMLNSYSGWAAAATGFMLGNDLLIVTGALVGSSGAILSYIMCNAMNRNFISVIAGGFGGGAPTAPKADGAAAEPQGEVVPVSASETAELLRDAKSVIIVPGYGMAVAQAQHTVNEITRTLRDKGVNERALGRSQGALRHRAGDGRDQRRLPGHRCGHGHWRQRHREPCGPGRPDQPDRGYAGARSLEGPHQHCHEALHGQRLCRCGQPAFLQRQQPHAVW
jgi:NAD(P) transhydrogenase subunit beta